MKNKTMKKEIGKKNVSKSAHKKDWNLRLLYKSANDPQIETDLKVFEKAFENFNKKYTKSKNYLVEAKELKKALDDYYALEKLDGVVKPYAYFRWANDIGNNSDNVQKMLTKIESRMNNASNDVVFFPISLKKIPKEKQDAFLNNSILKEYKYVLKLIFDSSKHALNESEQKILNLKDQPANSMWVDALDRALSKRTVKFKGKELSVGEASNILRDLPTNDKRKVWAEIIKVYASLGEFAEAEINAVYTDKKINDGLCNYEKPYSRTIKNYENEEKDIEEFVKLITDNFHISNKFFTLKKKLLKLPYLTYADRNGSIGKINRKYDFDSGKKITENAFSKVDPKYTKIFQNFLKNGQIDIFPKKGKTSGAYCWSTYNTPTVVFLNYVNNFDSVNTLAHEMGHAFHSEMSKSQPIQYQDYTMSVAETASTLFENFVFDEVFETLNDKEKVIALHDKIQSTVATIFRQIACFNFEYEMHMKVREQGYVPLKEILKIMNKHMSAYLGKSVKLTEDDGYFFVNWSHIRRPFYVYSYAFGELISGALYESYKKDKGYLEKIETFLSAGGSMSPKDIFKNAGIDISDINFFKKGLKKIEADIDLLEKLTR